MDNIADPNNVRWIHIFEDEDGAPPGQTTTPENDSGIPRGGMGPGPPLLEGGDGSHGTRMLDMVTGARGGTSKRVKPIVCRLLLC